MSLPLATHMSPDTFEKYREAAMVSMRHMFSGNQDLRTLATSLVEGRGFMAVRLI